MRLPANGLAGLMISESRNGFAGDVSQQNTNYNRRLNSTSGLMESGCKKHLLSHFFTQFLKPTALVVSGQLRARRANKGSEKTRRRRLAGIFHE